MAAGNEGAVRWRGVVAQMFKDYELRIAELHAEMADLKEGMAAVGEAMIALVPEEIGDGSIVDEVLTIIEKFANLKKENTNEQEPVDNNVEATQEKNQDASTDGSAV